MNPAEIFWPVFWAMIVSGGLFELFHLVLGLFMSWRTMRRALTMREQLAKKMGVDPSELEVMSDMYSTGFPEMGEGFPSTGLSPQTPTVNKDEKGNRGHGQYL